MANSAEWPDFSMLVSTTHKESTRPPGAVPSVVTTVAMSIAMRNPATFHISQDTDRARMPGVSLGTRASASQPAAARP
jgi:hypothetical protein